MVRNPHHPDALDCGTTYKGVTVPLILRHRHFVFGSEGGGKMPPPFISPDRGRALAATVLGWGDIVGGVKGLTRVKLVRPANRAGGLGD